MRIGLRRGMAAPVAVFGALAVALGAGAGPAGATGGSAPTPTWGAVTYSSLSESSGSPLTGSVTEITDVTCPSYGKCVATGVQQSIGGSSAVAMVENGPGQWSQPFTAPLPNNAKSGGTPAFTSVGCTSATSCVAVGAYPTTSNGNQPVAVPFTVSGASVTFGTPQQVTLPGNALTTSSQGAFLSGVSCGAGGCVAVGTYETTGTPLWAAITATPGAGGTWTATAVTPPSGATDDNVLYAISCPSSGPCEAVGNSAKGTTDTQLWAVQVSGGVAGTAQPVSIASASPESSNAPEVGNFFNTSTDLAAVSCPSAGTCIAAGTFKGPAGEPEGALVPISSGTPGAGSPLSVNGTDVFAALDGISCSDASDCTAVGVALSEGATDSALAANESGGTWSSTAIPGSVASGGGLSIVAPTTVACTSATVCVSGADALAETVSGTTQTESESSSFAYSAIAPAVTTSSLPAATVGQPYSATLQSSGGLGTGSWALTLGSLPAGLTLNASTGVISGTPTAVGQSGFAVAQTTAGPPSLSSAATSLSITVGAARPVASISLAYSKATGGSAVLVLSCSGAPCAGSYELTAVEHLRGGVPTAVVARADSKRTKPKKPKPRSVMVTLASGSYSLGAGSTQAIDIKLSGKVQRLLHKLHRISGQLTLTPTGATTPALVEKLTFKSGR